MLQNSGRESFPKHPPLGHLNFAVSISRTAQNAVHVPSSNQQYLATAAWAEQDINYIGHNTLRTEQGKRPWNDMDIKGPLGIKVHEVDLGMGHACHPSPQEAEEGWRLGVQGSA